MSSAVSLDPLLVRDARTQVVQHIQELKLGSVDEHDTAVLLRSKCAGVLRQKRMKCWRMSLRS